MKKTQSNSIVKLKLIDKNLTLESLLSDEEIIKYVGRKVYIIRIGQTFSDSRPISCSSDLAAQKYDYKQYERLPESEQPTFRSLCEYTLIGVNSKNQLVLSNDFKVLHLYDMN